MADNDGAAHWTIERLAPFGIVLTAITYLIAVTWWGADLNSNVKAQDLRITRLEMQSLGDSSMLQAMRVDIARIDERVAFLVEHQKRAEAK